MHTARQISYFSLSRIFQRNLRTVLFHAAKTAPILTIHYYTFTLLLFPRQSKCDYRDTVSDLFSATI